MDETHTLNNITRRLTLAFSSNRSHAVLPEAKALLDSLENHSVKQVDEWLAYLRNQTGSIQALCGAERALQSDAGPHGCQTLGAFLEAWVEDDLLDWCAQADEDAAAYTDEHVPERRKPHVYRIYVPSSTSDEIALVQLRTRIHPNPMADSMLWSEREIDTSDPVALAIALAFIDNVIEYFASTKPPLLRYGPLDRFHPERFITQHPSARALSSLARAMNSKKQPGPTMDDFKRVQEAMVKDAQTRLFELPQSIIHGLPRLGSAPLAQAGSLASHLVMWMAAGRQIYDLPPSLVERFRQTDVDDVPLHMLKFPYDSLYLYWGAQTDLVLEDGWLVDGAYVQSGMNDLLQLMVTAAPINPNEGAMWPIKGEPYYYQAFEQDTLSMDVGTAVDTVLSKELFELQQRVSTPAMDVNAQIQERVSNGDIEPTQAPRHVVDVSARTAAQQIDRLSRRHAVYVDALKLVVNALCYLTAYPDDSTSEFPAGAPEQLIKSAASSDFKTAKSAKGRLAELGYLPVHLCGKELLALSPRNVGDGHKRAHWRRGHWRRQPYGEGRALRKLIWVMPMVVGSKENEDPPGHIYLVS